MVHALSEAQRVLKPNGLLLDLRPGAEHRRVGVGRGARYQGVGRMREKFDEDHAADRAVAQVVQAGLFKVEGRTRFECNRVLDNLDDFRVWLEEFVTLGQLPSHARLAQQVERAIGARAGRPKIVVSGPLVLRVLRKRLEGISI